MRKPTVQVGMQWWEQAGIYLEVDRDRAAVAVETDEDGREH